MEAYDLRIHGGLIVDGSGSVPFVGDVALRGKLIAYVGLALDPDTPCVNSLDASGLVVSPGFIDIHTHSDLQVLAEPFGLSKIHDGVTTECGGNCGYSAFPRNKGEQLEYPFAENLDLETLWTDFSSYTKTIEEQGTGINRAWLVGHGTLRTSIVGKDNRLATKKELAAMKAALDRDLEAGAVGLSTGLSYPPGCFAPTEELILLAEVVQEHKGFYATHVRNEGAGALPSLEEALKITKATGVRTQISHLKTFRRENWEKLPKLFALIENARSNSLPVLVDRYPYIATHTTLDAVLPDWAYEGGREAMISRLHNQSKRREILSYLSSEYPKNYWKDLVLALAPTGRNARSEGLSLESIAKKRNCNVLEACLDIITEEKGFAAANFHMLCEKNLQQILKQDWAMIGSDGAARAPSGPVSGGRPHPRCYGTFSRILGKYVREKHLLNLPTAIRKMTSLPAQQMGLIDRGRIAPGVFADLTLFNAELIDDRATFDKPHNFSSGIVHVFVNGVATIRYGIHTGALAGKVLKH